MDGLDWLGHSSNQSRQQGAPVQHKTALLLLLLRLLRLLTFAAACATAAATALTSLSEGMGRGGASRPAPLLSCRFLVGGVRFGSRGPPASIIDRLSAAAAASRFRRACWMTRRRRQRSRYEGDMGTTEEEEGMAMAASI